MGLVIWFHFSGKPSRYDLSEARTGGSNLQNMFERNMQTPRSQHMKYTDLGYTQLLWQDEDESWESDEEVRCQWTFLPKSTMLLLLMMMMMMSMIDYVAIDHDNDDDDEDGGDNVALCFVFVFLCVSHEHSCTHKMALLTCSICIRQSESRDVERRVEVRPLLAFWLRTFQAP